MVLETKSRLEGAVIGGGHSVAASRLDAQRSVAGWVSEQMGGLSYLFYIRDLVSATSLTHPPPPHLPPLPLCKTSLLASTFCLYTSMSRHSPDLAQKLCGQSYVHMMFAKLQD